MTTNDWTIHLTKDCIERNLRGIETVQFGAATLRVVPSKIILRSEVGPHGTVCITAKQTVADSEGEFCAAYDEVERRRVHKLTKRVHFLFDGRMTIDEFVNEVARIEGGWVSDDDDE